MNHLQFFRVCLAGWINRKQQNVIEYLQEEVKVLKEQLGKKPRLPATSIVSLPWRRCSPASPPWPARPEAIELFQVLKPVGAFESCRFADWQNQAVTIRGARSASAIYSRPYESWLVLGNLNESAQEVGVVLHPDKLPYLFRQR